MKKVSLAALAFALLVTAGSANAASNSVAFGTGFNFGAVRTNAATISAGTAAAGSLATGTNTSLGAGFGVATPAGTIASGVGASAGQSNSISGAASIGNGAAATAGNSANVGLGVGLGGMRVGNLSSRRAYLWISQPHVDRCRGMTYQTLMSHWGS